MRQYTPITRSQDIAWLDALASQATSSPKYQKALEALGQRLAEVVLAKIGSDLPEQLCVVCTAEDADGLGNGIVLTLTEAGLAERVRVICFWNDRIELDNGDIAPIVKEYREPCDLESSALIVAKSIIASACVVRTNLSTMIAKECPKQIFVLAPVMFKGADESLASEFESRVSDLFQYVTFAVDDEKDDNNYVVPGVGGSIYQRLGFQTPQDKNRHIPSLVQSRRNQSFHAAVA